MDPVTTAEVNFTAAIQPERCKIPKLLSESNARDTSATRMDMAFPSRPMRSSLVSGQIHLLNHRRDMNAASAGTACRPV